MWNAIIYYLQGYYDENKFIAAQGPTDNNISDFWLMIWQQNIKHIVMVTRLFEANKVMSEHWCIVYVWEMLLLMVDTTIISNIRIKK